MPKAYFIADLHLGATYNAADKALERRVVAFLDAISTDATELYLLGDILDYWFEYRYVVPRGYVRFFGKLAQLADAGVKITWIIGNHDIWIFDYLPAELGIRVVDGVLECDILGTRFCIQHGDAVGGSRKFRVLRTLFRNRVLQKLFSGIHPRWTVGFAYAWSRHSRLSARQRGAGACAPGQQRWLDAVRAWCEERIAGGDPSRYYLFGHLHRGVEENLSDGRKLIVLPDWPSAEGYGVFDGENFYVMQHI